MLHHATKRAQNAGELAQRHAHACRQHEVDTVHLMLGLLEEGTGVAAIVLQQLRVDLVKAREHLPTGEGPERESTDPVPPTHAFEDCLATAEGLAKELGATLNTEHLLLGLLTDPSGGIPTLLEALGTTPDKVRREVYGVLGVSPPSAGTVDQGPPLRVPSPSEQSASGSPQRATGAEASRGMSFMLMVGGGGASVLGVLAMLAMSQSIGPDTKLPKIVALPIAGGFVAFYVGLVQTVFGQKVARDEDEEEEMSGLQLAAILIPFILMMVGLMPLMAWLSQ